MTNREYFGEKEVAHLESRLQQFLDSKAGGFVFIYTGDPNKVTDAYRSVCADCVLDVIEGTLTDAARVGLLAQSGDAHNHSPHS